MTTQNPLKAIMEARSIAFLGASNNPSTMGTIQIIHLLRGGYKGKVWPVHPTEKTVLGVPAHQRVADLPEVPELAVLVLPTRIVPDILDECGEKGIKHAVVVSGGFKERGEEGRALEEKLKAVAKKHGIRFVGPNCIGVINAHRSMNFTFFTYSLGPGPMGIMSQSGTYVTQVLSHLENRGVNYSKAVSLGNEANIDIVDGISYLGEDPDTKAIALYIETIRRGKEFIETAKRVCLKKPIVAYYVGGTEAGARSGVSHTGAMGGNDLIYDAVFKQCGIIRAPTVEHLYDWTWALATTPLPEGRRAAIVSQSGGPVTSMADTCSRHNIEVPVLSKETQEKIAPFVPHTGSTQNPVDFTFSMNPSVMVCDVPQTIFESGEVDAILIHGVMGSTMLRTLKEEAPDLVNVPDDPAMMKAAMEGVFKGMAALFHEKNYTIITSTFDDRSDTAVEYVMEQKIPVYPSPERAVQALAAVMQYAEWKRAHETKS